MHRMNWTALCVAIGVTVAAAIAGNLFIPGDALRWFRNLPRPRWLVPYPVLVAVGTAYYPLIGTVLYRAIDQGHVPSVGLALVVIAGNEAWNAAFFGLRSTLAGFLGILVFAVPLAALGVATRTDAMAVVLLAGYGLWVGYDVAWTAALWRRDRGDRRLPAR
jgi:tryptophan-rich sensory protein